MHAPTGTDSGTGAFCVGCGIVRAGPGVSAATGTADADGAGAVVVCPRVPSGFAAGRIVDPGTGPAFKEAMA